ncbi:MAG TPA: NADH-quinone oxidoreductase subunit M, partial [Planctomycetota bacterium]|nr:NADH-quinone oxidoreductase subunit M [Planctomycetota bacterium]
MPSHGLTWIAFTPLLGALCVLAVPRQRTTWVRALALVATLVPLALASWMCVAFERGTAEFQFVERADWLLSLRAEYHVGVDGLSLALVWLTTLTSFVAVAASSR